MFERCPDFVRQLLEYFGRFFSGVEHTHEEYQNPVNWDDRYYTESETDALLAGKADDPHTHPDYSLDGHNHDERYFTESETNALLADKADDPHTHPDYSLDGHNHDERYFTESETNALLAGKADDPPVNDDRYYTESETDALLAGKADNGHWHSVRGCEVSLSGDYSLPGADAWYTVPFSGIAEGGGPNPFGNGIKIDRAGWHLVQCQFIMYTSSGSMAYRYAVIAVNGVNKKLAISYVNFWNSISLVVPMYLVAEDLVTFVVKASAAGIQISGSSANTWSRIVEMFPSSDQL